ncbi:MAG: RidA family protein [Desulfovibrio sp.]|uniref:RidA family protein n=1 Tax=Desulfovibrio sp. TaxID=885 RepID=UPI002A363946|nr:RidA family protein [Desulfovibrio sp.]MDY0259117.1 RidA family protein [Desulfovibrio sp.]
MHTRILSNKAPAALGPYSQGIRTTNRLYISGQLGVDTATGTMPEEFAEQAALVMKNIGFILDEAGFEFNDIVKTTIFLSSMNDFNVINEIYGAYFTEHKPARSCFEVGRLPKDAKVEIEVIAEK